MHVSGTLGSVDMHASLTLEESNCMVVELYKIEMHANGTLDQNAC